jgi:hypothetical protein
MQHLEFSHKGNQTKANCLLEQDQLPKRAEKGWKGGLFPYLDDIFH